VVVESHEFDWQTGDHIVSDYTDNEQKIAGHHDILLTGAPILKLQDMLSSTWNVFEIQPGSYEWNYPEDGQMVSIVACGADPRDYVEKNPSLKIPEYNRMEEVGYSVYCERKPGTLVVREYYRTALENPQEEPVSVQNYDEVFMIKLKPNRYYEIYATWEEQDQDINGFYGNATYALVTDV